MSFKKIIEKIKMSERILILSHINPDGDAVGSGLALMLALHEYNKQEKAKERKENYLEKIIRFGLEDSVPSNLKFLEGSELIEKEENIDSKYEFDLVICVDSANKERVGKAKRFLDRDSFVINIDHHTSNTMYGDINYVLDASSTSEIMYGFIEELGVSFTKEIGEAIYTGISNDTGNFAHSNVKKSTFEIAGKLIDLGINNSLITRKLYSDKKLSSLKIMGLALKEMVTDSEKKFTHFYLNQKDLMENNATKEDTEGIVTLINSSHESEVSLFLREEKDGLIKGSLRSKEDVDVNKIAGLFNGGGHIKAAGFTSDLSATEIIKIIKENI